MPHWSHHKVRFKRDNSIPMIIQTPRIIKIIFLSSLPDKHQSLHGFHRKRGTSVKFLGYYRHGPYVASLKKEWLAPFFSVSVRTASCPGLESIWMPKLTHKCSHLTTYNCQKQKWSKCLSTDNVTRGQAWSLDHTVPVIQREGQSIQHAVLVKCGESQGMGIQSLP